MAAIKGWRPVSWQWLDEGTNERMAVRLEAPPDHFQLRIIYMLHASDVWNHQGETYGWDGNRAMPTLTPSLDFQDNYGNSLWHGNLIAGAFVAV